MPPRKKKMKEEETQETQEIQETQETQALQFCGSCTWYQVGGWQGPTCGNPKSGNYQKRMAEYKGCQAWSPKVV